MGKFDKAKAAQGIKDVAKASNEQANLITIKYYKDEDLLDYPKNNEDISFTEDIEKSIEEQGFTDPIEITDFGMEDGKSMIVSGHRRRRAGRNKGMKSFPCIMRHFKSEQEVQNYVLFANAQRDSARDPLLFAKRYKMHEEYLKESGFKGSMREEIASRLGLKPAQADRYNQMNRVILPIWDMVREGTVGMSSITDSGLYTHAPEEQEEILQLMKESLEAGSELTRPRLKELVSAYRDGKRTLQEIAQEKIEEEQPVAPQSNGQGVSLMNVNTEPAETAEDEAEANPLRNNEINYDYSHREGLDEKDQYAEERLTEEDYQTINAVKESEKKEPVEEEKKELTEAEKRLQAGEKISKTVTNLEELLNNFYDFRDKEQATLSLKTMTGLVKIILAEMEDIGEKYEIKSVFTEAITDMEHELEEYKNE